MKDLHPKIGAGTPTILTPHEEKEIAVILQVLQETGFGLIKDLAGIVIRDYLIQPLLRWNSWERLVEPIFEMLGFTAKSKETTALTHT